MTIHIDCLSIGQYTKNRLGIKVLLYRDREIMGKLKHLEGPRQFQDAFIRSTTVLSISSTRRYTTTFLVKVIGHEKATLKINLLYLLPTATKLHGVQHMYRLYNCALDPIKPERDDPSPLGNTISQKGKIGFLVDAR